MRHVWLLGLLLCAAVAPVVPATAANVPPLRAIAIAEDERRWADGELAAFLKHGDPRVRARAALAVGRLQDSTSVAALEPLVIDLSAGVRREAVFALGQVAHRSARATLERALLDLDPQVVLLAAEALGKLQDKAATPRIAALLYASPPQLRAAAAVALWRLADTTAIPSLVQRLADPDPAVRWRVVYALEKTVDPARIVPAVTPLLADRDPLVRAHAARTLGRQKSSLATRALVNACVAESAAVTVNAVRALGLVADSTTADALPALGALLAHRDPAVSVTAATALADAWAWKSANATDVAQARRALRAATAHADAATRGAAARALVTRFGADERDVWTAVATDERSVYARVGALDGLRAPAAAALAPGALTASLGADRELLERMTAADLAGALHARDHAVALEAVLPVLREGVRDTSTLFAASCAGALGEWGDRESVPMLAAEYAARGRDADPDARQAIRGALAQLAGEAFADSIERAHHAPAAPRAYAADFERAPRARRAVLETSAGVMEWEFFGDEAPQTVRNFVALARRGYFDGLRVHRVVPDFVIQDGDPTGTGSGGPGWTIRCEYNQRRYETGMVGMALSGKDTGGSQWFVTLSPQPHLDGRYTIFAHVVRGQDVAARITQGAVIRKVRIRP